MNNANPDRFGEILAREAYTNQRQIVWHQTNVIVATILDAVSILRAALSGESAKGSQKTSKALYSLSEALFPEVGVDREEKAAKAKYILEREHRKGNIKIKPLGKGRRSRAVRPKHNV